MSFNRATALLIIQFMDKYNESATVTTLAFGLYSATFAFFNLFMPTVMLRRFEVKTLAVTGAVINVCSIVVIAFAPNMIVINFMMASIGLSNSLISVPQTTLIGRYFRKRLSFATAFVNLGLSIATIFSPPMTHLLLNNYGLQGTILILAAFSMNSVPASMLFRPVSVYREVGVGSATDVKKTDTSGALDLDVKKQERTDTKLKERSAFSKIKSPGRNLKKCLSDTTYKGTSKMAAMNAQATSDVLSSSQVPSRRHSRSVNTVSDFLDVVSQYSTLKYLSYSEFSMGASASVDPMDGSLSSEFSDVEDICVSTEASEKDNIRSKKSFSESTPSQSLKKPRIRRYAKLKHSVSKSIYSHPLGILLVFAFGVGVHSSTTTAYMPSVGKENGLTDEQVPYLITVIGVGDLVSKVAVGIFADLGFVEHIRIPCVCELLTGTLLQFMIFFKGFEKMIVFQIMVGLTIGVLHTMLPVIVVDILGVKHLGHIMAGYFLVSGVSLFCDHLVIGLIKDMTGSFIYGFNYMGCLMFLSSFLLLLEPLVANTWPPPKASAGR